MEKTTCRPHGWSYFWFVLIFGLILAALNITLGIGATVRFPNTSVSISLGGSLGRKELAPQALPGYLRSQIGDNSTFFNQSGTLTIWLVEGMGILVLGNQPQAPAADLTFNVKR
jgi:hypothetical protein